MEHQRHQVTAEHEEGEDGVITGPRGDLPEMGLDDHKGVDVAKNSNMPGACARTTFHLNPDKELRSISPPPDVTPFIHAVAVFGVMEACGAYFSAEKNLTAAARFLYCNPRRGLLAQLQST